MNSFKQFLIEQSRSKHDALKLLSFLKKRHTDKQGEFKTSHDIDQHFAKRQREIGASGGFGIEQQVKDNPKLVRHKIIRMSKLKPIQSRVNADKVKEKIMQHGDNHGPITVVKHKGQLYVGDGHHRWMAHKILGKKTIEANVVYLKEDEID